MAKRTIILGAGESGTGAAILATRLGDDVLVSDGGAILQKYKEELRTHGIAWEENGHSEALILNADEIVKSPGIPEKATIMKAIRAKGISVISEIELAYRHKGDSMIVAVTGTNGKSTTTSLIYHMAKTAGLSCALVGNIGISFARQVALDPKALYVAEISSFQLDDIQTFKPNIAILLNITEDHLDRYNYNIENYIHSKFQIIKNQDINDCFIYCDDDPFTLKFLPKYYHNAIKLFPFSMKQQEEQGAFIKDGQMTIRVKEEEVNMSINDFALKGKHNQLNTMAAGLSASALGIRKEKIRESVQTFDSLKHRMEGVLTIKGVQYINDSKSTNTNCTWYALESLESPVVLLIGGVDKGNDYTLLEEMVTEKVKTLICIGKDNSKLIDFFKEKVPQIIECDKMEDAVKYAYAVATKGDTVLLSPSCASFDLFLNYEDRGNQFIEAVKAL